jgi:hypothetical protein
MADGSILYFLVFTIIITSHIIAINCTINMLPIINGAPGQCIILNARPIINTIKLAIKRVIGYLKSENM